MRYEKNIVGLGAIVAFVLKFLNLIPVKAMQMEATTSFSVLADACRNGANLFLNGCGWVQFGNTMLTIIAIALALYYIYWNFDELQVDVKGLLERLKK